MISPLSKPIKYSITVPASKSLFNRALLCAALAQGKSVLTNPVYCDDTKYMITALQQLGVRIVTTTRQVTVYGCAGHFKATVKRIYIGNAGTVKRFLTPFLPVGTQLVGNKRMQQRPIQHLTQALQTLQHTNQVTIAGNVSSQFISALLLLAPTLPDGLVLKVTGKLVSAPYVQMTIQLLKHFGIKVKQRNNIFLISHQTYQASHYEVEGDASSATYWWALAAITGSHVTVPNIPLDTLQPDATFKQLLQRMGCTVRGNTVIGPLSKPLKAVRVNMSAYPDAVMSAAIVMAKANGISIIRGVEHLAHKESNRLQVVVANLKKVGVPAHCTQVAITIHGKVVQPGRTAIIQTHNDHRIAMAFSLFGIKVDNKACVTKSYPNFWEDLKKIQQHSRLQTLVLTGMRGVGKTTYGKQLAKQLKMKFIDTDDLIVETCHGMSLQDLVKQHGWQYFRNVEHQVIKKIAKKNNVVIATGGGTLMYPRNVQLLKQHYIILMTAPLFTLKKRLKQQTHRPALTVGQSVVGELESVWQQRQAKYYQVADTVYDSR